MSQDCTLFFKVKKLYLGAKKFGKKGFLKISFFSRRYSRFTIYMLVKLFSKWTLGKLFYLKKLMIEVLKTYFDIVKKLCVFAVIDYINKMSA